MQGLLSARTKRRVKKLSVALVATIFALLLVIVPDPALDGARKGLALCGNTVIPSLFPFLVVSSFIIGAGFAKNCGKLFEPLMKKVFRLPGSAAAPLILGAIGGYPVGASAVSQLCSKGELTKKDAQRLLCFAINSSPAFIIGAVGAGFLKNPLAGILLYIAHLATSLTIGILMRPWKRKKEKTPFHRERTNLHENKAAAGKENVGLSSAFVGSVTASAKSIIIICAFVVLFSAVNSLLSGTGAIDALSGFLSSFLPSPGGDSIFFARIITGVLEVTNGCAAATGAGGLTAVLLSAAILGFSGISVMFQVISLVRDCGISTKSFIITRFLHAGISVLYALILFLLIPSAIPQIPCLATMAFTVSGMTATMHSIPAVFAMLLLIGLLLLSVATV